MAEITVQRRDQVMWVTVERPAALNALNHTVLEEFHSSFNEADRDPDLRAMIITGSGEKAFVAGADIKEIQQLNPALALAFGEMGQTVLRQLERLKIPVIAMVNGFALGGGLELALACDYILASDNAKFGLPEVSLGLIPGFGGTQRLARVIGLARARELIYTGRMLSASEALQWGLVNRVVPLAELKKTVEESLQLILSRGPMAIAAAKEVIGQGFDLSLDAGLECERQSFAALFHQSEVREGTAAFIEKRKPQFNGRHV
jgi:enoyl-CoA hydratase